MMKGQHPRLHIDSIVSSRIEQGSGAGKLNFEQESSRVRLPQATSNSSVDVAKANDAKKDLPQYETPSMKEINGLQSRSALLHHQRSARNLYRSLRKDPA